MTASSPDTFHPIRQLTAPTLHNFRDMGGYQGQDGRSVRWGCLYRSGHLSDIDHDTGALLGQKSITRVVDFRSRQEKGSNPVSFPESWQPRYHDVPIGGNAAAWVRELLERLSTSPFPAQDLRDQFILAFETIPLANAAGLRRLFDALLASEPESPDNSADAGATPTPGATLFHCTAGKDRTGIAGMLVLSALGVGKDQIMEDFLLTNSAVDVTTQSEELAAWVSQKTGRTISARDVLPLKGVEPAFLNAAIAAITREYGSVQAYLEQAMGLTRAKCEHLHRLYLIP